MISNFLKALWQDESGLSAVEYAVAGSLIVAGIVTAFTQLGTEVSDEIDNICESMDSDDSGCAAGDG